MRAQFQQRGVLAAERFAFGAVRRRRRLGDPAARTARHFAATGKWPPPRPVRFSASMRGDQVRSGGRRRVRPGPEAAAVAGEVVGDEIGDGGLRVADVAHGATEHRYVRRRIRAGPGEARSPGGGRHRLQLRETVGGGPAGVARDRDDHDEDTGCEVHREQGGGVTAGRARRAATTSTRATAATLWIGHHTRRGSRPAKAAVTPGGQTCPQRDDAQRGGDRAVRGVHRQQRARPADPCVLVGGQHHDVQHGEHQREHGERDVHPDPGGRIRAGAVARAAGARARGPSARAPAAGSTSRRPAARPRIHGAIRLPATRCAAVADQVAGERSADRDRADHGERPQAPAAQVLHGGCSHDACQITYSRPASLIDSDRSSPIQSAARPSRFAAASIPVGAFEEEHLRPHLGVGGVGTDDGDRAQAAAAGRPGPRIDQVVRRPPARRPVPQPDRGRGAGGVADAAGRRPARRRRTGPRRRRSSRRRRARCRPGSSRRRRPGRTTACCR